MSGTDLIIVYYNSSNIVEQVATHILEISHLFRRIYAVNNGSVDDTAELLIKFLGGRATNIVVVNLEKNMHLGGAIKYAMNLSDSPHIGWVHGDMVINKAIYETFIQHINDGHQFVKAMRKERRVFESIVTLALSIYASFCLKKLLTDISAVPCFIDSRHKLEIQKNAADDYAFDLGVFLYAKTRKLKIKRVPTAQHSLKNNTSTWARTLNGYRSMARLWIKNIRDAKVQASL
jgi:glycosyltransferase involved in cell wall biosynthesis